MTWVNLTELGPAHLEGCRDKRRIMADLVQQFASLNLTSQSLQLVIVASTFMRDGFECVIGWSIEDKKLIRPVTNLVGNSWILGRFTVGYNYQFLIVDSNPSYAIYPHKREDIIVQENSVEVFMLMTVDPPVPVQYAESQMYDMLFGCSVESVDSVFYPGVIYEKKYIITGTVCPSVGILRCTVGDIKMYQISNSRNPSRTSTRCQISQGSETFDFPVTAQNRDALMSLNNQYASNPILVLLGLGRPYAGTGNIFNPLRCYILLIGVISPPMPLCPAWSADHAGEVEAQSVLTRI